ncbi:50S ribosomal protein L11 methyltransferase [Candidatus Methylacidithermus pantelleriae]|uniref:Ribosomal protein L11 methyltransferase n=1 Tax=Candidatus Methylacidithermus pantelleriae TaxID=2744239 RepID=A0A8J2FNF9_9BACT|nr:50S ribosomal protein L11 methyltransferase [Candidatus Methylacidithermus pantelleriae]CAF0695812.1 Ribosomal protein L11 methyltransferase [Candidatus Methylacidithermus pantelleriae]
MPTVKKVWWVWRRLISPRWEDSWIERLRWAGQDKVAVHHVAGRKFSRLEAYFPSSQKARSIQRAFGGTVSQVCLPKSLGETLKPVSLGRRLTIYPEKPKTQSPGHPFLVIPPGPAFGSGHHPTTQLLLQALLDLPSLSGKALLDVGTGSGIVALAGRLFGAQPVIGLDIDPQAISEAPKNEKRNFRGGQIHWICANFLQWETEARFDIVCANLFASCFISGAQTFALWMRPEGRLLATGVLMNQKDEVRKALSQAGFLWEGTLTKRQWILDRWLWPGKKTETFASAHP